MGKGENIVLIGFMGSGKSSVGQALSRRLQLPVLDSDDLITERAGMSISDIFQEKGESYFRLLERDIVKELSEREEPFILSSGGGLPLREENLVYLRRIGMIVYLSVGVDVLERRLAGDSKRPLLHQQGTVRESIIRILTEREPRYRNAADVVVLNEGKTFQELVDEILLLREAFRRGDR